MRGSRAHAQVARFALACAILAGGCESATSPGASVPGPSELSADAVGTTTVRVSWRAAASDDIASYEVERRSDLTGDFAVIEGSVPPSASARIAWFDTKVEANRYYGYRVRAVNRFGARSSMSNIAGTKTAPMPGILIRTNTASPNPQSVDPDGYTAVIRGQRDTQSVALGVTAERLVPVARGAYSVALRGLATNCAVATSADTVKQATVTDEGTQTVSDISFIVSCRDPRKASIVVAHSTLGDTSDIDGLALTIAGIILEPGTPDNERVYFQTRTIGAGLGGGNGATRFDNLRLGDYDITVADIDAPCELNGGARQSIKPRALAVDTVRFSLTCRKPVVIDTAGKPFILGHKWSSSSARPGDKVSLLTTLDLRAQASQLALSAAAEFAFDNTVVRYDSARTTGAFELTTVSRPVPTVLAIAATNLDGQGKGGEIQIVRTWFTVVGASGSSVRTSTTLGDVLTPQLAQFRTKVRVEDATLTISGTAPVNQSPTARVTAPATGTAGAPVAFSGSTSSDADGTIASYAWSFGDNTSGSGVSATHTYSSAGSYTARLTVTDDRGATGSVDHPIVVSAASGTSGTIAGTVTSSAGGVAGATVTVTGGPTATTSSSGAYSIANVATGSRTVTVSTLPTGCTAPASQTVTVAANATATLNFTVQCTTNAQAGTLTGKVTQGVGGAGIAGVVVAVQPTGGTALATVSTSTDGSYTVTNVPVGSGSSAGAGSITLSGLPSHCANPGSQAYTGLAAGGTVTKNIAVTCTSVSLGTVSGTITRASGGALSGVAVTLTPTGGAALASVTTDGTGAYTIAGVALGDGSIALGALPAGCTNPGAQSYSGVTSGGTVTKNVTVTCTVSGAHTYPFSAAWGPITTTGPTGRQVTLVFSVDMGAAPGRPDIDGNNADPLAGISFAAGYDGAKLDYISRALLPPGGEFDLGAVNETGAGTAGAQANVAISSTSGGTLTGNIQLIRLLFNIATGTSGAITPTIVLGEALATSSLTTVTSSVVVTPMPTLTIP